MSSAAQTLTKCNRSIGPADALWPHNSKRTAQQLAIRSRRPLLTMLMQSVRHRWPTSTTTARSPKTPKDGRWRMALRPVNMTNARFEWTRAKQAELLRDATPALRPRSSPRPAKCSARRARSRRCRSGRPSRWGIEARSQFSLKTRGWAAIYRSLSWILESSGSPWIESSPSTMGLEALAEGDDGKSHCL